MSFLQNQDAVKVYYVMSEMFSGPLKTKWLPKQNYFAVFTETKETYRFTIDDDKGHTPLPLFDAELYDIAINDKCFGACDYCYISALSSGHNYADICNKALKLWGGNKPRPFQVAIGGAGEPTLHPDFPEFLETLHGLGIMPNFTTNGMKVSKEVLKATKEFVGGVSITLHPHLEKFWRKAIPEYCEVNKEVHAHVVIYEPSDIEKMKQYLIEFPYITLVLLPFRHVGFGVNYDEKETDFYDELMDTIVEHGWQKRVAYGAGFIPYLKERNIVSASLYDDIYSYYLDFDMDGTMFQDSFSWETPIERDFFARKYT